MGNKMKAMHFIEVLTFWSGGAACGSLQRFIWQLFFMFSSGCGSSITQLISYPHRRAFSSTCNKKKIKLYVLHIKNNLNTVQHTALIPNIKLQYYLKQACFQELFFMLLLKK